ncbi:MAG: glucose 1-dehydrogenase [Acidobacteria bacterium]|nr:glucose 1-dehydrogenase [Acidobacteriota bacterium]
MFDLTGKSALITGGASGIGEAIARAFVAQGARVVIGDRDASRALQLAEEIGAEGTALDVTDPRSLRAAMDRAIDAAGGLDLLVNCAGLMHVGKLHETEPEDYDRIQAVNARGVYLACRAAIEPMLRRRSGNIINIASVASLIAVERRFAYCVSKGAVLEMTRALAIDYARDGIRANAICPGTVDTPMIRGYVQKYFGDDVAGTLAQLHERQPIGRMGEAREIAALAVFLAADESAFMTGAALPIDGGWTAK